MYLKIYYSKVDIFNIIFNFTDSHTKYQLRHDADLKITFHVFDLYLVFKDLMFTIFKWSAGSKRTG